MINISIMDYLPHQQLAAVSAVVQPAWESHISPVRAWQPWGLLLYNLLQSNHSLWCWMEIHPTHWKISNYTLYKMLILLLMQFKRNVWIFLRFVLFLCRKCIWISMIYKIWDIFLQKPQICLFSLLISSYPDSTPRRRWLPPLGHQWPTHHTGGVLSG